MKTIFLNCMGFKRAKDIFVLIAKKLNSRYKGEEPLQANLFVMARIVAKAAKPVLLVLDKIDQLKTRTFCIRYSNGLISRDPS